MKPTHLFALFGVVLVILSIPDVFTFIVDKDIALYFYLICIIGLSILLVSLLIMEDDESPWTIINKIRLAIKPKLTVKDAQQVLDKLDKEQQEFFLESNLKNIKQSTLIEMFKKIRMEDYILKDMSSVDLYNELKRRGFKG